MAKQSSKHANVAQISYVFTGGLNLADPPTTIAEGELSDCRNMWYPLGSSSLEVRPGVEFVTATPASGAKMTNLHPYVKGDTNSWLVASFDNGKCYHISNAALAGSSASWTEFHTLGAADVVPPLLNFHDKLIIGDITTNLMSWDGSTTATLANSPKSTALAEVGGRIASNSADDLDAIIFSVPENETNWLIASGASFLRVGYGDGQQVKGFVPYASDLLVFKAGESSGRVARLANAALDDANWSVAAVTDGMPLTGSQSVAFVGNNILYGTKGGVFDLAGVQEYGSVRTGVAGRKINPALNGKTVRNVSYLPSLGLSLVFLNNDYRIYVYHPYAGAWTMIDVGQKRLVGACELGSGIYFGAEDGTLYRLTSGDSSDELTSGVSTAFASLARGRQEVMRGEAISRRARLFYELLSGSTIELNAIAPDGLTRTNILTINGQTDAGLLYDATGYLNDASQLLYASSTWYRTGRARIREQSLTAEVRASSGRYRIKQADFELAQVNG